MDIFEEAKFCIWWQTVEIIIIIDAMIIYRYLSFELL